MDNLASVYLSRIYALTGEFGTIHSGYVSGAPTSAFDWVLDPAAGATKSAPAAGAVWKLADKYHAEIAFRAYCRGYFFDATRLARDLSAINRMQDQESPMRPFLMPEQVSSIVASMVAYTRTNGVAIQTDIDAFLNKSLELLTMLDGGFSLANKAAYTAFYADSAVAAKITLCYNNFAASVWLWVNMIKDQAAASGVTFNTSASLYQSNAEATVKALVVSQLAGFFTADAVTGIRTLNKAGLIDWLTTNLLALTATPILIAPYGTTAYDTAVRAAELVNAPLTPASLGAPQKIKVTEVTASGVNAKKAELETLAARVDAYYADIKEESGQVLETLISAFLNGSDIKSNLPTIITRLLDSRYYVTTWVTAWGEESAPSPPSDMVEVDQNDVCIVYRDSTVPSGRGIVGWRVYRSNSSNTQAQFQLVPDLALISSSSVVTSGVTPAGIAEEVVRKVYAEINRTGLTGVTDAEVQWWVNESVALSRTPAQIRAAMIAAVLDTTPSVVARVPATVRATAQALTADVSLTLAGGGYNCYKSATTAYTDAVAASQLGEVLPTTTWLEPPAKLQNMVGMANGVMAGHFDNVVCFCEAYTPYAWPVEYQIPLAYPIVGKASFGQSLVVGTMKATYYISGSDPASMSAQLLPGDVPCVSARSIVSVDTGVVFASTDGLCLVDSSGPKIITAGLFSHADWQALSPTSMVGAYHDGIYYFTHTGGCHAIDMATGTLVEATLTASALYRDGITDTLCAVNGTAISTLMTGAASKTATYKTGVIKLGSHQPFAWIQVDADFVDIGGTASPVTVKWYGDGALVHTFTVSNIKPARVPAGRYLEHQFEIQSKSRVTGVRLYGSTQELQSV